MRTSRSSAGSIDGTSPKRSLTRPRCAASRSAPGSCPRRSSPWSPAWSISRNSPPRMAAMLGPSTGARKPAAESLNGRTRPGARGLRKAVPGDLPQEPRPADPQLARGARAIPSRALERMRDDPPLVVTIGETRRRNVDDEPLETLGRGGRDRLRPALGFRPPGLLQPPEVARDEREIRGPGQHGGHGERGVPRCGDDADRPLRIAGLPDALESLRAVDAVQIDDQDRGRGQSHRSTRGTPHPPPPGDRIRIETPGGGGWGER